MREFIGAGRPEWDRGHRGREVIGISSLTNANPVHGALAETGIDPTQLVMLALAIGGLTIVVLSTYRKNRRSRLMSPPPVREQYQQANHRSVATDDVQQAMVELDRLARQIHGQIDTRFAKLDAVIRDADQRIATLSRLVNGSCSSPPLDIRLASQAPPKSVPAATIKPTDKPHVPLSDQRYDAIYQLADSGVSTVDIARKAGKTKGEVELILALRDSRRRGAAPESVAR